MKTSGHKLSANTTLAARENAFFPSHRLIFFSRWHVLCLRTEMSRLRLFLLSSQISSDASVDSQYAFMPCLSNFVTKGFIYYLLFLLFYFILLFLLFYFILLFILFYFIIIIYSLYSVFHNVIIWYSLDGAAT